MTPYLFKYKKVWEHLSIWETRHFEHSGQDKNILIQVVFLLLVGPKHVSNSLVLKQKTERLEFGLSLDYFES